MIKYIIIYPILILQLLGLFTGLAFKKDCSFKIRGEKLVPLYRLGCYLGEKVQ